MVKLLGCVNIGEDPWFRENVMKQYFYNSTTISVHFNSFICSFIHWVSLKALSYNLILIV